MSADKKCSIVAVSPTNTQADNGRTGRGRRRRNEMRFPLGNVKENKASISPRGEIRAVARQKILAKAAKNKSGRREPASPDAGTPVENEGESRPVRNVPEKKAPPAGSRASGAKWASSRTQSHLARSEFFQFRTHAPQCRWPKSAFL